MPRVFVSTFFSVMCWKLGFSGNSDGEESCQCRRRGLDPWGVKNPLEEAMATHPSAGSCSLPISKDVLFLLE